MINNMDTLMFLISAIIAVAIVVWMASGNNRVGNYRVGENDSPETSRPLLLGEGTNYGLSKGSIYNQYNCNKLPEPSYYPSIPTKEVCLYCREEDIFHNDEHDFQGDDGIMFNHKNGIFYLVMEHFRGEINMVEIKNCPKCGRRL